MSRTFLVTGVSSGLGRAFATAALEAGHTVIGTVRNPDRIAAFEQFAPGRAHARVPDVTDTDAIAQTVAAVEAKVGPIDVLSTTPATASSPPWEVCAPSPVRPSITAPSSPSRASRPRSPWRSQRSACTSRRSSPAPSAPTGPAAPCTAWRAPSPTTTRSSPDPRTPPRHARSAARRSRPGRPRPARRRGGRKAAGPPHPRQRRPPPRRRRPLRLRCGDSRLGRAVDVHRPPRRGTDRVRAALPRGTTCALARIRR